MIGRSYSQRYLSSKGAPCFLPTSFGLTVLRDHCKMAKVATTYTANDFKLCTAIVLELNRWSKPPITLKLAAS